MSRFVSVMSASVDHPIFIDVDNILMVTDGGIIFTEGKKAKLHNIYTFHYDNIIKQIEKCSTDEWIYLGNVNTDLGSLFINKKYFKGLNFVNDNYQIILERGDYNGELEIRDLSIDDAKKIIETLSD